MEFKIIDITPINNVGLSLNNIRLPKGEPVWQRPLTQKAEGQKTQNAWAPDDEDDPQGGFKYAAAFKINKGPAGLKINIDITKVNPWDQGKYDLKGYYLIFDSNQPMFKGNFRIPGNNDKKGVKGPILVEVTLQQDYEPKSFRRILGDFRWSLSRSDTKDTGKDSCNRTFLSFYWLHDDYEDINGLFKRGIPVEILHKVARAIWVKVKIQGSQKDRVTDLNFKLNMKKEMVIDAVVNWCFSTNPPRYDIVGKGDHFVERNSIDQITLFLKAYLSAVNNPTKESRCNCYDQAGVLQVFLNAIGIDVKYGYLDKPFFLSPTMLVGRGICNNPAYGLEKTNALVHDKLPNRSYFHNHAFCLLENKQVFDSCIGPHTFDIDKKEYIEYIFDNRHPENNYIKSIKVEDLNPVGGVKSIDWNKCLKQEPDLPYLKDFKKTIGFPAVGIKSKNVEQEKLKLLKKFVVYKWSDMNLSGKIIPCSFLKKRKSMETLFEDIIPGSGEVIKIWRFNRKGEYVDINLYVSCNSEAPTSLYRFFTRGSLGSSGDLCYEKGPSFLGHYSVQVITRDQSRYLWVYHNLVFDVKFINVSFDEKPLLKHLQGKAKKRRNKKKKENLHKYLISKADFSCSLLTPTGKKETIKIADKTVKVNIHVGRWMKIEYKGERDVLLDFTYEAGSGLEFSGGTEKTLEFLAVKESTGENKLLLVAVDKNTLFSRTIVFINTINPGQDVPESTMNTE